MIFQEDAKIVFHLKITSGYFKMALVAPKIAKLAKPGQFLHIKITDGDEILLRRPFSIHRSSYKVLKNKIVEILYKVAGKGTEILSHKKVGDDLNILGPLGNGFELPTVIHSNLPILVAGGIGVVPLLFLAEELIANFLSDNHKDMLVLLGAKTKKEIICEKEFKKLGCRVKISTDDGSRGFKGKVTSLLRFSLSTIDYRLSTIYTCGPKPMLKEISEISKRYNIPAQASLEEHMACGIGACLGCVVNTKGGYKRVCKEGPVFNIDEIIW